MNQTSYRPVIFILCTLLLWMPVIPQENSQKGEPQVKIKYFRTNFTREELLGKEISEKEAMKINHFKATYDLTGKLLSIEFIPVGEKSKKKPKKKISFPKPTGPFRYFDSWNPHTHELGGEFEEKKIGDRPFYRVTFEDSTHVKTVEYFQKKRHLLWTYYLKWNREKSESVLSVVFASHRPLIALDPHLFHPTLSEMKPGWVAAFKHNRLGKPLEVQVRDEMGNLYYFYKFRYRFETVGDTLNPITHKITTSEYYRADSTLLGSHTLIFTDDNRLWKKEYYDQKGKLTETIEYDYDPDLKELTVIIRDPKGTILHQQVMSK